MSNGCEKCAAMRAALENANGMLDLVAKDIYPDEMQVRVLLRQVNEALSTDAGKDYVHVSIVAEMRYVVHSLLDKLKLPTSGDTEQLKEAQEARRTAIRVLDGHQVGKDWVSPEEHQRLKDEATKPLHVEIERYQQWVHDCQASMYINCVYCGYRYGPDDEVEATMQQALYDHIAECPKHPMSWMKKQLEQAQAEAEKLRGQHLSSISYQERLRKQLYQTEADKQKAQAEMKIMDDHIRLHVQRCNEYQAEAAAVTKHLEAGHTCTQCGHHCTLESATILDGIAAEALLERLREADNLESNLRQAWADNKKLEAVRDAARVYRNYVIGGRLDIAFAALDAAKETK